jgi:hypothetical protein
MPRVAVVQDGTEFARQTDADITGYFERCCETLSADGPRFTSRTFTDEAVGSLLHSIDPQEYACLVIASNALSSGQIERAVLRRKADLRGYLVRGGGLVVLHQLCDSLEAVLPEDLCPMLVDRRAGRGTGRARAYDPTDLILNYPSTVDLQPFTDGGFGIGPPSLFYKSLRPELPEGLKPILTYGDEVLITRTYDHADERVVVTTLPLDWQRALDLLANAIRYACAGQPRRLVWQEKAGAHGKLLTQWLTIDGAASVRLVPESGQEIPAPERWLLDNVDVVVVAPSRLESIRRRDEVRHFLSRGGTLVSADDSHQPVSQITALVGAYTERVRASHLYGELRATGGWQAVDFAFELRNIATALAFLWDNTANRSAGAVNPAELDTLRSAVEERLRDARHREDLSSSLAHVQSLAFLSGGRTLDHDLVDWMLDDPRRKRFDVGLQIRAVRSLALREPDPTLASDAAAALEGDEGASSLAAVIRVLDAVATLDQAELFASPAAATCELTARFCDVLERARPEPGVGWLSVEATADATRGLVAILRHLPPDEVDLAARAADRVGAAVGVLRPASRHYERSRKGVAWLARVTHAVILADRYFPIGLERLASLDWPDQSPGEPSTGDHDGSLLERLASENKVLRERQRELEQDQLAARVGRSVATAGGAVLVAVPFSYVLIRVGFESIWALLGNVTVLLTMLLGIVAGVFTLLTRYRLLARPAMRLHQWIGETVPVLSALSKLRRK